MILSFVKIDVSAAICKMTEIYIRMNMKPYEYLNLSKVYQRYIPLAVLALNCVAS